MNTTISNEQFAEKNFRHNFVCNLADGALFWFGYSFISPNTILPLFVSHFSTNPFIIGLIPFISTAGYLLPQLFMSNLVQRAPKKKFFPVTLGFFLERIPIFLLAPLTLLIAPHYPSIALIVFFLLFAWHTLGAGICSVGWQDMIAKIIPTKRRGRYFGITNFVGNGSGILGGFLVTWLLARYIFPIGFVYIFLAAGILIFVSWLALSQTREPADVNLKPVISQKEYLKSLPAVLRENPNFVRYMIAQVVIGLSTMSVGFLTVYAVQHWQLSDSQVGGFTVLLLIGQTLSNLVLGWLADHFGHKLILELSLIANVICFALAFFAPLPFFFYIIFFLRGINAAGTFLSGTSIALEFSSAEDRPTFIGLANTIPGIASGLSPFIGSLIATLAGYPLLFLASTLIGIIGFIILHWFVNEPRLSNKTISVELQP